jgi:hypothetical protein
MTTASDTRMKAEQLDIRQFAVEIPANGMHAGPGKLHPFSVYTLCCHSENRTEEKEDNPTEQNKIEMPGFLYL